MRGKVKWFSREKGYGFITDEQARDHYYSVQDVRAQARESHQVVTTVLPFDATVRAIIEGRTFGFCKLVADRENYRILGCHVVGERAVEITQLAAIAIAAQMPSMSWPFASRVIPESLIGIGEVVYFVDRGSKGVLKLSDQSSVPRIEPILNLEQIISDIDWTIRESSLSTQSGNRGRSWGRPPVFRPRPAISSQRTGI
jgi:hypothetical protein